jgi:hypothetical protein
MIWHGYGVMDGMNGWMDGRTEGWIYFWCVEWKNVKCPDTYFFARWTQYWLNDGMMGIWLAYHRIAL